MVSPASLSFAPDTWDMPQEVTVTAITDANLVNDVGTLEFTASGGDYVATNASVGLTVVELAISLVVTPATLEVAEAAGTASYTVALSAQPSAEVTVTISSSMPGAALVQVESAGRRRRLY